MFRWIEHWENIWTSFEQMLEYVSDINKTTLFRSHKLINRLLSKKQLSYFLNVSELFASWIEVVGENCFLNHCSINGISAFFISGWALQSIAVDFSTSAFTCYQFTNFSSQMLPLTGRAYIYGRLQQTLHWML